MAYPGFEPTDLHSVRSDTNFVQLADCTTTTQCGLKIGYNIMQWWVLREMEETDKNNHLVQLKMIEKGLKGTSGENYLVCHQTVNQ